MASYAYFDTKRKIKREPEIGCIFGKSGCIRSKVKREKIELGNHWFNRDMHKHQ